MQRTRNRKNSHLCFLGKILPLAWCMSSVSIGPGISLVRRQFLVCARRQGVYSRLFILRIGLSLEDENLAD